MWLGTFKCHGIEDVEARNCVSWYNCNFNGAFFSSSWVLNGFSVMVIKEKAIQRRLKLKMIHFSKLRMFSASEWNWDAVLEERVPCCNTQILSTINIYRRVVNKGWYIRKQLLVFLTETSLSLSQRAATKNNNWNVLETGSTLKLEK